MSKIYLSLFTILILFTTLVSAQKKGQERIDSLEIELSKSTKDVHQIELLKEISKDLLNNPFKDAKPYIIERISLAEKIQNTNEVAKGHHDLGAYYLNKSKYQEAVESYTKSQKFFLKIEDIEGEASAFWGIGSAYMNMRDYENAFLYTSKGLKKAEQSDSKQIQAKSHT